VQLTDELLAELDALRERQGGRGRSELIREAIERYLAPYRARSLDDAIVAGYARVPPDEDLGAAWSAGASVRAEPWEQAPVDRDPPA